MALVPKDMADAIRKEMGFPTPVSKEIIGFATGIIQEMTGQGLASFGGIPGPHFIGLMTPPTLAQKIATASGFPNVTPQMLGFATGFITHISTKGLVFYAGPDPDSGPNWFIGGVISGLVPAEMAELIAKNAGYPKVTSELLKMCTAISNYIMANAQVVSGKIS